MQRILIIDDDTTLCKLLKTFLEKNKFEVVAVYSAESAFKRIQEVKFDIILTDVRLPHKDGHEILKKVKENIPNTQVILMTGYAEVNLAVDAIKMGAFDYISKPIHPEKLLETIKKALAEMGTKSSANSQNKLEKKSPKKSASTTTLGSPEYLKGISEASNKLENYITLVAPTNMSVLITGDSGTGKEYIAKQIHDQSKRSQAPFVAVDCGAIPKELGVSEFFGHLKGSFTGAVNNKTGHFEAANTGTLFLDEIGNLPYDLQVQLLRALQERKIKPLGSNHEIKVDIRIITATNENLEKAVEEGEFREDLFHRLNEFSIQAPPLRERTEDIVIFANHFLEKANEELDKTILGFNDEVIDIFKTYDWPGNLRELYNYIKRAVLFTEGNEITKDKLPHKLTDPKSHSAIKEESLFKNNNEKQMIIDALKKAGGNKSKAARILKIDRKTLYNRLKLYHIES